MKCEIIKDLLPSYIDGLTSSESNAEIVEHLKNCPQCNEVFKQMKAEVNVPDKKYSQIEIKPFKKLNKKILHSVLITLAVCILAVGSYLYFFGIGWKVSSEDMNIEYTYQNGIVLFEFELTNGMVLNSWSNIGETGKVIKFTECFETNLDNRGENPNQFSFNFEL